MEFNELNRGFGAVGMKQMLVKTCQIRLLGGESGVFKLMASTDR